MKVAMEVESLRGRPGSPPTHFLRPPNTLRGPRSPPGTQPGRTRRGGGRWEGGARKETAPSQAEGEGLGVIQKWGF